MPVYLTLAPHIMLPYKAILLSKQYLQKYTKYTFLRWIVRMKPFFDAYFGPFKDKLCYWFRILLLIQVILLLTFAIVQYPNVGTVAINIAAALTPLSKTAIEDVYKKQYLSIWENSFFYQPDNTFINNIVHLSKWRKPVRFYVHSSWHNLCPIHYNCVLSYSNEERDKESHAEVACKPST